MAELYGADDYIETEAAGIARVIARQFGTDRVMSLRGAVDFDKGSPGETE